MVASSPRNSAATAFISPRNSVAMAFISLRSWVVAVFRSVRNAAVWVSRSVRNAAVWVSRSVRVAAVSPLERMARTMASACRVSMPAASSERAALRVSNGVEFMVGPLKFGAQLSYPLPVRPRIET